MEIIDEATYLKLRIQLFRLLYWFAFARSVTSTLARGVRTVGTRVSRYGDSETELSPQARFASL